MTEIKNTDITISKLQKEIQEARPETTEQIRELKSKKKLLRLALDEESE